MAFDNTEVERRARPGDGRRPTGAAAAAAAAARGRRSGADVAGTGGGRCHDGESSNGGWEGANTAAAPRQTGCYDRGSGGALHVACAAGRSSAWAEGAWPANAGAEGGVRKNEHWRGASTTPFVRADGWAQPRFPTASGQRRRPPTTGRVWVAAATRPLPLGVGGAATAKASRVGPLRDVAVRWARAPSPSFLFCPRGAATGRPPPPTLPPAHPCGGGRSHPRCGSHEQWERRRRRVGGGCGGRGSAGRQRGLDLGSTPPRTRAPAVLPPVPTGHTGQQERVGVRVSHGWADPPGTPLPSVAPYLCHPPLLAVCRGECTRLRCTRHTTTLPPLPPCARRSYEEAQTAMEAAA